MVNLTFAWNGDWKHMIGMINLYCACVCVHHKHVCRVWVHARVGVSAYAGAYLCMWTCMDVSHSSISFFSMWLIG